MTRRDIIEYKKYRVYKDGEFDRDYTTKSGAERREKEINYTKKGKKKKIQFDVEIKTVPKKIDVGMSIYRDGKLKGKIASEGEEYWYIKIPNSNILSPMNKSTLIEAIADEYYYCVED